jgi:hypothetical protein
MVANPSGAFTACVRINADSRMQIGSTKLGSYLVPQFGLIGPDPGHLATVPGPRQAWNTFSDGGATAGVIEGICGLLTLGGPNRNPVYDLYVLCAELLMAIDSGVTPYKFQIEEAGPVANFKLAGLDGVGPVFDMPIKIHVTGIGVGPNCYIGSDAQPIVLRLTSVGSAMTHHIDTDVGDEDVTFHWYRDFNSANGSFVAAPFAAPAAKDCGGADPVINAFLGLPKATGNSFKSTRDAYLHTTTAGGAVLAASYHASLG